jgi:hypothetical protein
MFVCCECCVLSGRGLCNELITRPEESYQLWRVVVCDQETSKMRRLKPSNRLWKYTHNGLQRQENKQITTTVENRGYTVKRIYATSLSPFFQHLKVGAAVSIHDLSNSVFT